MISIYYRLYSCSKVSWRKENVSKNITRKRSAYTVQLCTRWTHRVQSRVVQLRRGILRSYKKEGHLAICNNTARAWRLDLEGIVLKWNKSDRERQISYDITYIRDLKKTQTKENKNKLTKYREQSGGYRNGKGKMDEKKPLSGEGWW